jgi:hypothetical protein
MLPHRNLSNLILCEIGAAIPRYFSEWPVILKPNSPMFRQALIEYDNKDPFRKDIVNFEDIPLDSARFVPLWT